MDVGNTYILRNKLESDVGEAVDVTETILVLDAVGAILWQFVRRLTSRSKVIVLSVSIGSIMIGYPLSCHYIPVTARCTKVKIAMIRNRMIDARLQLRPACAAMPNIPPAPAKNKTT